MQEPENTDTSIAMRKKRFIDEPPRLDFSKCQRIQSCSDITESRSGNFKINGVRKLKELEDTSDGNTSEETYRSIVSSLSSSLLSRNTIVSSSKSHGIYAISKRPNTAIDNQDNQIKNENTPEANEPDKKTSVGQYNKGIRHLDPKRWHADEDEKLIRAVKLFGVTDWKINSDYVGTRDNVQCRQRWQKVLKPGLKKGKWTQAEDDKLRSLVYLHPDDWPSISSQIEGRSSKQCRERWKHHLSPEVNASAMSKEEDMRLLQLYKRFRTSWSQIAARMPGRTENMVRSRLHHLVKVQKCLLNENIVSKYNNCFKPIDLSMITSMNIVENAVKIFNEVNREIPQEKQSKVAEVEISNGSTCDGKYSHQIDMADKFPLQDSVSQPLVSTQCIPLALGKESIPRVSLLHPDNTKKFPSTSVPIYGNIPSQFAYVNNSSYACNLLDQYINSNENLFNQSNQLSALYQNYCNQFKSECLQNFGVEFSPRYNILLSQSGAGLTSVNNLLTLDQHYLYYQGLNPFHPSRADAWLMSQGGSSLSLKSLKDFSFLDAECGV